MLPVMSLLAPSNSKHVICAYFFTELDVSFSDDAETPRSGRRSSHSSGASEGVPPELPPRTPSRPVTITCPLVNGINTPRYPD